VARTDSSSLTDGCRLVYGTAEFKSGNVVLTRAHEVFRAHKDFALWKVIISSSWKRSAVLGLLRPSHLAGNENLTLPSQFCLDYRFAQPRSEYKDEPTGIESGHSNGGISNPVRTHLRLCRHHSLLAGTALLRVILLLDHRDRRLSYAARPRAARAPNAIRTAR
jgi:hypothetical protein